MKTLQAFGMGLGVTTIVVSLAAGINGTSGSSPPVSVARWTRPDNLTAQAFVRRAYVYLDRTTNWRRQEVADGVFLNVPTGGPAFVTLQEVATGALLEVEVPATGCYLQSDDVLEFDFVNGDISMAASHGRGAYALPTITCWPVANLDSWGYVGGCWSKIFLNPGTGCTWRQCNKTNTCNFAVTIDGETSAYEGTCGGETPSEATRCGTDLCWEP